MIKFKATEEQVAEILALAVNASKPAGLGFLHYDSTRKFTAKDMLSFADDRGSFYTDYVQGRMVKCYIRYNEADDTWELDEPREDYQSWIRKYPTAESLIRAAGIKV